MQKHIKKCVSFLETIIVHGKEIIHEVKRKLVVTRTFKKIDNLSKRPLIIPSVKDFLKNYDENTEEDVMAHFKNRFSKQA